jgi:hypothetical protein
MFVFDPERVERVLDVLPAFASLLGDPRSEGRPLAVFGPYSGLFNHASYEHDVCYGSQIRTKQSCDRGLIHNMESACLSNWKLWVVNVLTGGLSEGGCQTAVGGA